MEYFQVIPSDLLPIILRKISNSEVFLNLLSTFDYLDNERYWNIFSEKWGAVSLIRSLLNATSGRNVFSHFGRDLIMLKQTRLKRVLSEWKKLDWLISYNNELIRSDGYHALLDLFNDLLYEDETEAAKIIFDRFEHLRPGYMGEFILEYIRNTEEISDEMFKFIINLYDEEFRSDIFLKLFDNINIPSQITLNLFEEYKVGLSPDIMAKLFRRDFELQKYFIEKYSTEFKSDCRYSKSFINEILSALSKDEIGIISSHDLLYPLYELYINCKKLSSVDA